MWRKFKGLLAGRNADSDRLEEQRDNRATLLLPDVHRKASPSRRLVAVPSGLD